MRYGAAILFPIVALILYGALTILLGPGLPIYILFYPTIIFVALFAGFRQGVLATFISVILTGIWIIPPIGQFSIGSPINDVGAILFTFFGVLISIISELYHRTRDKAAAASLYTRSLIEASLDPLVTIGKDGKITDVNYSTEAVTGLKREELIGTDFSDYFTEPEKAREGYKGVFQEGFVRDFPLEIIHKNGHITHVLYNASVYKNEVGEVIGVFAAARDITELKKAEEELKKSQKELSDINATLELRVKERNEELLVTNEELITSNEHLRLIQNELRETISKLEISNKELEQFAYVASHDLQEPLRMVASFTQLLEARYKDKLDAEGLEYIGFAVDGAKRMQSLINDLLAYSRVTSVTNELQPVDMRKVLDEVLFNLEINIEENHAVISKEPLPVIFADYSQMVRVFQNLIGNAIKYRTKKTPKIHISAVKEDKYWLFGIKDNGIGIEPEYTNKIFDIFRRLHTKEEYDGTGVGLAITKKIIENHGGKIWVESEPGKGSTFYFTIPKY